MNFLATIFQKFPVLLLLIGSAIFIAAGDVFAKSWSLNTKNSLYFIALFFYAASPIFYIPTLLKEGLAVTTAIWSILIILVSVFIGIVIFKEVLSPMRVAGIILGITSLVILNFVK